MTHSCKKTRAEFHSNKCTNAYTYLGQEWLHPLMEAPTQSLPPFLFRARMTSKSLPGFLEGIISISPCSSNIGNYMSWSRRQSVTRSKVTRDNLSCDGRIHQNKFLVLFILSSFRIFSCAIFPNIKLNAIIWLIIMPFNCMCHFFLVYTWCHFFLCHFFKVPFFPVPFFPVPIFPVPFFQATVSICTWLHAEYCVWTCIK